MRKLLSAIRISLSILCSRIPVLSRLAPLFYPRNTETNHQFFGSAHSDHLIIFLHGFTGDSRTTWINNTTRFDFPQELAKDVDDAYIISFNYVSHLDTAQSILSIVKHLEFEIGELLKAHPYRTLRFVAHSMGGIIARQYILRQPHLHPEATVTHLVSLGTPTNGSELASLTWLVPKNRQVEEMQHIDRGNTYLESLNDDWNRTFKAERHRSRHLLFCAAYEQLDLVLVGKAVRLSSAIAMADESIGFQTNHIDLAKPKGRDDVLYRWVKAKLQEPLDPRDAVLVQRLAGSIRDSVNDPLPGVQVALPSFGFTAVTDELGRFHFEVKTRKQESIEFIAQKAGYKTYEGYATLGNANLTFTMRANEK